MSKPRAEPRPDDEPKPEDQVTKLISSPAPNSSSERSDSKRVTFEIPLEGTTVRPPASRPNTRRQMRPNTPRADAGELALRQENAQKRREDAMTSRAHGLGKRGQDLGTYQKDVRQVKAQELLDKVGKRMKKHGDNRKKQIENIVTKQADNSDRIQKQVCGDSIILHSFISIKWLEKEKVEWMEGKRNEKNERSWGETQRGQLRY